MSLVVAAERCAYMCWTCLGDLPGLGVCSKTALLAGWLHVVGSCFVLRFRVRILGGCRPAPATANMWHGGSHL